MTSVSVTGSPRASRRLGAPGRTLRPRQRLALNLVAIVGAIAVWHIAAVIKDNPLVFPTPMATVEALGDLLTEASMRSEVFVTLWRILIGFALGSALGVTAASVIGSSRLAAQALEPVVHFLRSITPVAWIVPATIWFGVGDASMRFIVIYATLFPVLLNTLAGMAQVPKNKIRMARVFGASRLRTYRSVIMPSAVPYVLIGMRLSLGYSFMSVVGAEMVAGSNGLGYLIYQARLFFDTPTMFAGILVLGAAGLIVDRIFVMGTARGFRRFFAGQAAQ